MRRVTTAVAVAGVALVLSAGCRMPSDVTPPVRDGQKVTVPAVVGERLSDAQATLLKVGLTNVDSQDAEGDDSVLDGNHWKVVRQTPAAHTVVTGNVTITLAVKRA